MRVGSLLGVPVKINVWFLVTLLALALLGLLPQSLVLFISVLIHELAHSLAARAYGLRAEEVELLPFGGVAKIEDLGALDPEVEKTIAMAGPAASLFLAALSWAVQNDWPLYPEILVYGVFGNLALATVNLLPALPLDGGRILRAYLAGSLGYRRATQIALISARVWSVTLICGGAYLLYLGTGNLSIPVAGIFLWFAAKKEEFYSRYLFVRYITRRRAELGKRGPRPVESLLCSYQTPVKEVVRYFLPQRYHLVYLLGQNKELLGYVTELEIIEALLNQGLDIPLADLPVHPLGRE